MANTVTHFEIYGEDLPALADFYQELFGWQIKKAPGIDYHTIQLGTNGSAGLRGGLQRRPIAEPRSWVHYISVADIDATVGEVIRLGGKVLREKTAVPQTAWYAVVEDPEGNVFAVWQADATAYPPPLPE
ncbi:MAG: VOC family protein [Thermomicrobiales bacterium]